MQGRQNATEKKQDLDADAAKASFNLESAMVRFCTVGGDLAEPPSELGAQKHL